MDENSREQRDRPGDPRFLLLTLQAGRPCEWFTGSTPEAVIEQVPFDAHDLRMLVDTHPVWTPGAHLLGAWQGREVWLLITAGSPA